jgi:hypothetical protein
MRITSTGNVGIGTTSPSERLMVSGNVRASGYFQANDGTRDFYFNPGGDFGAGALPTIQVASNHALQFATNNTLRLTIASTGAATFSSSVTAGSNSTIVSSDGTYGAGYGSIGFGGNSNGYNRVFGGVGTGDGLFLASATGKAIYFRPNGGTADFMTITSGGELLINTTSDAGDYKLQVNGQIYSNISGAADNNSKIEGNGSFLQIVGRADYASVNIAGTGTNNWEWGIRGETTLRLKENGNNRISIFSGGATEFSSSIKTAAPSGGTAKPYKLGEAGVAIGGSDGYAVKVEIDGTLYYLMTGYLPEPEPEAQAGPSMGYKTQFEQPVIKIKSDYQKIKDLEKEIAELKELIKSKIK